jgi:hypothetical protein
MKLKRIILLAAAFMLGLTALTSCGGSSTSTGSTNTATGENPATGTLTISGDAVVPTSVTVTTANYQSDQFSSGIIWKVTVGSDDISINIGLSHDGVAATEFPKATVAFYVGGQSANPTDYYNWAGGTNGAGKTVGLVVDETARTATFTNVVLPGGSHFAGTPGATTQTTVTTSLTLNGTITY